MRTILIVLLLLTTNFTLAQENNNSTSCLKTCTAQCTCPSGPNGISCSGHGQCMEDTRSCLCVEPWIPATDGPHIGSCSIELFNFDGMPYAFVMSVALVCVLTSVITSVIYIYHRDHQVMVYFRPCFGHLMNFGTLLGTAVVLYAINDSSTTDVHCRAMWWLLDYAFVFVFGTLMAKTYRNYRILKNTRNESLRLSDGWVLRVIVLLLIIETLILISLLALDKLPSNTSRDWNQVDETTERFEGCFFDSRTTFVALIPSKVLTICLVFFLATKLRKLKSDFNESHAIFLSSGLSLFVWAIAVTLYTLTEFQYGDMFYTTLVLSVCIPFTVINVTLCIPKLFAIRYQPSKGIKKLSQSDRRLSILLSGPGGADSMDINKYLREVTWSDVGNVELAERLLDIHHEGGVSSLKVDVILLLLSRKVRHRRIRKIASLALLELKVRTMNLYLPQFVQALQFEPHLLELRNSISTDNGIVVAPPASGASISSLSSSGDSATSPLLEVLIKRSSKDFEIAQRLLWLLSVEVESLEILTLVENGVPRRVKQEKRVKPIYNFALEALYSALEKEDYEASVLLTQQQELVRQINEAYQLVLSQSGDVLSKTQFLKQSLVEGKLQSFRNLKIFTQTLPHPLYSHVMVNGIIPQSCSIFKSSAKPMKLSFSIDEEEQRRKVQGVLAAASAMRNSKSEKSNSIVLNFDNDVSSKTYVSTINVISGRNFRKKDGSYFVRVDCNGKMKKTEAVVSSSSVHWDCEMEFKSAVEPQELEVYVFGKSRSSKSGKDGMRKNNQISELQSAASTSQIDDEVVSSVQESRKGVVLGQVTFPFDSVLEASEGKVSGWFDIRDECENVTGEIQLEVSVKVLEGKALSFHETQDANVVEKLDLNLKNMMNKVNTQVIFKIGDDLRQDQLALQMITIMDEILIENGMDLKITHYRVLPTSPDSGFMEFVPNSYAISAVLEENNHNILDFLRNHNFDIHAENNVSPAALETFIKSTAGYCVMTMILGVGDRHLDNIMIQRDGSVFHIDYGFLFGHDPKPFPPPFRLIPEMVRAMGGINSKNFDNFTLLASQAFNILRENSSVILGALELMSKAGIPDMKENPRQILADVKQKLLLNATSEKAGQFMRGLIRNSQNTKTKTRLTVMEQIHKFAVSIQ